MTIPEPNIPETVQVPIYLNDESDTNFSKWTKIIMVPLSIIMVFFNILFFSVTVEWVIATNSYVISFLLLLLVLYSIIVLGMNVSEKYANSKFTGKSLSAIIILDILLVLAVYFKKQNNM